MEIPDVGFSGTQLGMTLIQKEKLTSYLVRFFPFILRAHHGDCIGADAEFHSILKEHFPNCKVIGHPPLNPSKRAWCSFDEVFPLLPYLERNKSIVESCTFFITTPKETEEVQRSGTWSTIRYARKLRKTGLIFYPNGETISL